jgi:hypothetical protein
MHSDTNAHSFWYATVLSSKDQPRVMRQTVIKHSILHFCKLAKRRDAQDQAQESDMAQLPVRAQALLPFAAQLTKWELEQAVTWALEQELAPGRALPPELVTVLAQEWAPEREWGT